eukprot:259646_1
MFTLLTQLISLFWVVFELINAKSNDLIVGGNFLTLNKCGQYAQYQQWTVHSNKSITLTLNNTNCLICAQNNPDNLIKYCKWGFIPAISTSTHTCNPTTNAMAAWTVSHMKNNNNLISIKTHNGYCIQSIGAEEYAEILTMKCNLTNFNYLYQQWIYDNKTKYIVSNYNNSLCLTASLYPQRNCSQSPYSKYPYCNTQLPTEQRLNDLISRLTFYEKITNLDHWNIGIPRLGLPPLTIIECLHGAVTQCGQKYNNNTGCPTSFPNPLLLGATFNRSVWHAIAQVISNEGRALYNQGIGGLICFAPNINLIRDPRWGRSQEVIGEDSYLTSEYALQYVNGLQNGVDTKYMKMGATLKHFADYDLEGGHYNITSRLAFNAIVTGDDQVEFYWPVWKKTIEETNPASIMCSYPSINGIPACSNDYFMNKMARDEWNFNGYFMSDGGALNDEAATIYVDNDNLKRTQYALEGGCDVNSGYIYPSYLNATYHAGYINMSSIDTALKRILRISILLGNLDSDYMNGAYYNNYGPEMVDTEYARNLAMDSAQQGIVLLKNDGILPLKRDNSIKYAFIGPHFNVTQDMLSNYRGDNILVNSHSPFQIAKQQKINVQYSIGCNVRCTSKQSFNDAINLAKTVDFVVMFLGLYPIGPQADGLEAEAYDRYNLSFPGYQLDLLKDIYNVNKQIVLVMINSSPIDLSYPKQNIPGILSAFYAGEMGGDAIISILFGDVSPSGKMPVTVYSNELVQDRNITDMSLTNNYGITYKYYQKEPVYKFGYGLYYTTFNYTYYNDSEDKILKLADNDSVAYKVGVTNTGNMNSSCVVLGFIYSEYDDGPRIQLFDFEKVFVEIGTTVNVTLTISAKSVVFGNREIQESCLYSMYLGDYMNNNFLKANLKAIV